MKVERMARKTAKPTAKKAAGRREKPNGGAGCANASMIADVTELVDLMVANDLSELHIEEGRRKILLKRGAPATVVAGPVVQTVPAAEMAPAPAAGSAPEAEAQAAAEAEEGLLEIKSPMVGTFYSSTGPDAEPFVSVGDIIGEDDVVGIVEAMKVMNEIKAECAGTVAEIIVKNAQPLEFGQVLMRVKAS